MFVAYESTCNKPATKADYIRREYDGDGDNYWRESPPGFAIDEATYDDLSDDDNAG